MPSVVMKLNDKMEFETIDEEREHRRVKIDVPSSMGGKVRGPSPSDFFIASITSCIGVYVVNYLKNAGMDPSGIEVELAFNLAEDPWRYTDMEATVRIPNADCASREKAIVKVAESCVIHHTFKHFEGLEIKVECPDV